MNHNEHHENKQKASLSVKKSAGTVNTILQMIADDKYCPEITQQIDAAIGLLQSAKKSLLIGHLDHCLENNLKNDRNAAIQELVKIFSLK